MSDTHTCSCGRTFESEPTLKYHLRVSKHAPVEAPAAVVEAVVEAVAIDPYEMAMQVLEAKRAEQAAYELKLNQTRLFDEVVDFGAELVTSIFRPFATVARNVMQPVVLAFAQVDAAARVASVRMG